MRCFNEQFITYAIPDAQVCGALPEDPSFVVDSRIAGLRDIFVALPGEKYDGHDFVADALQRGAAGALIAHGKRADCLRRIDNALAAKKVFIIVPNPLEALVTFASLWREQFAYPVVGVTGSIGKTSAKETISAVLNSANKSHLVSHGNQNTCIGIALNLLRMRSYHEVAVVEMGVSKRGEMAVLARMVKPTIGVITGVGHSHMEGLGSLYDIACEKRDIFKYFRESYVGIIDGDQSLLSRVAYAHPVVKYGRKTSNQIQARKIRIVGSATTCVIKLYNDKYEVLLPGVHSSVIKRSLIAASVGHVLQIAHESILDAIQKPLSVIDRFEEKTLTIGKGLVISDCYNASPESMKAALCAFHAIKTDAYKIAILGDMLELGVNSPFWHRQIGRFLQKITSLKRVVLVGEMVQWMRKTLPVTIEVIHVPTWQKALEKLPDVVGDHEVMMLVKGSHAVGLSNLVDQCTK